MKSLPATPAPNAVLAARALLVAGALLAAPATAGLRLEQGEARDPDSGALLYREQHLVREHEGQPRQRLVLYLCRDGTAFARKRIDYARSPLAPEFRLDDARLGYREGLRGGATPRLWVDEGALAPERSAEVAVAGLVADAGFDEFVRQRWAELLAGQPLPLRFAVPARLQSLPLDLRRVADTRLGGEAAVVFRLGYDGWLRWLAPEVEVTYGRDSRRLLRFEGLSNLREDDGRGQLRARIDFPAPAQAADEAQWQAFGQWPLAACATAGGTDVRTPADAPPA